MDMQCRLARIKVTELLGYGRMAWAAMMQSANDLADAMKRRTKQRAAEGRARKVKEDAESRKAAKKGADSAAKAPAAPKPSA